MSASSADEFDEVAFIDIQSDELTTSVDDVDTISLGVSSTNEDRVVGDLSLSDNGSRGDFNDEEMAEFGHNVQKTVLGSNVHVDGEIVGELRRHSQFTSLLKLRLSFLWWTFWRDLEIYQSTSNLLISLI